MPADPQVGRSVGRRPRPPGRSRSTVGGEGRRDHAAGPRTPPGRAAGNPRARAGHRAPARTCRRAVATVRTTHARVSGISQASAPLTAPGSTQGVRARDARASRYAPANARVPHPAGPRSVNGVALGCAAMECFLQHSTAVRQHARCFDTMIRAPRAHPPRNRLHPLGVRSAAFRGSLDLPNGTWGVSGTTRSRRIAGLSSPGSHKK